MSTFDPSTQSAKGNAQNVPKKKQIDAISQELKKPIEEYKAALKKLEGMKQQLIREEIAARNDPSKQAGAQDLQAQVDAQKKLVEALAAGLQPDALQ